MMESNCIQLIVKETSIDSFSKVNTLDNAIQKLVENTCVLPEIYDIIEFLIESTEKCSIYASQEKDKEIVVDNNGGKNEIRNIMEEKENSSDIKASNVINTAEDSDISKSSIDIADDEQISENNSVIKNKTFPPELKLPHSKTDSTSYKNMCNNLDQMSEEDSPIKVRKKKTKSLFQRDVSSDEEIEDSRGNSYVYDQQSESRIEDDQLSESDSPIKIRKKKIHCLLRETDIDINSDMDPTSASIDSFHFSKLKTDDDFEIKKKRKARCFLEEMDDSSDIKSDNTTDLTTDFCQDRKTDFPSEINERSADLSSEPVESIYSSNEITDNNLEMEEKFTDVNINEDENDKEDSDLKFESTIPSIKSSNRKVTGKELMRQALSLPYFHMPKPDFKEYMNKTDKLLEEPLLEIVPNDAKKSEKLKKITLKPENNIVFEIGPPKNSKVEPFRKKVLNMMNKITNSKLDTNDRLGIGGQKNIIAPIGAERLSWKMKLLQDIAKKKEAALKERNEMLEEVMETNEDIEDSENGDEDEVNVNFSDALNSALSAREDDVSKTTNIGADSLEVTAMHGDCSTAAMFCSSKSWEGEKDISSSLPLCFSLPSFQPEGGFPDSVDNSSSNHFSTSQVNLSFNDSELEKDSPDLPEFKLPSLELKESLLNDSISRHDEKLYDKVLTDGKLLTNEQSLPGELITSDVLDICSGQFLDNIEVPKTPPLTNLSSNEESDADMSDEDYTDNLNIDYASDSGSEEELNFKRKVLKKKVRPISPIDEESRYGEQGTDIQSPAKSEINSNFQFSKSLLSSPTEQVSDADDRNELNLNYDSEESLIDENKVTGKQESTKAIQDYFDIEAELSGEEGSSDEDEGELDGEEALEIDDTDLPSSEVLRDQIGSLHLKQLLDDDDRMIKEVKNHFLDEGELYSDAARQRKFNWTFNQSEAVDNQHSSGSDNEDEINDSPFQQDKLKWKQENRDTALTNVIESEPLETSFKIHVHRKISSQIIAQRAVHPINKRPRNSFLDEEDAKKSFKKFKLDVTDAQGTRATKNFVFVETNGATTRRKESKYKSVADSSVFDII